MAEVGEGRLKVCGKAEEALVVAINVVKVRCHMCGRRLNRRNLGYIRVKRDSTVELALCAWCLHDLEHAAPGGL